MCATDPATPRHRLDRGPADFRRRHRLAQQGGSDQTNQQQYEQRRDRDIQLRLGVGLDKPDTSDAEVYYSGAVRFRIGREHGEQGVWEGDTYRGRPPAEGSIRGYLEPEVAYWSRSKTNDDATDLLLGANLIGVVPTRGADFFIGVGFGYHFFDSKFLDDNDVLVSQNDGRLGGNLQVGVDVNLGAKVALSGTGRIESSTATGTTGRPRSSSACGSSCSRTPSGSGFGREGLLGGPSLESR